MRCANCLKEGGWWLEFFDQKLTHTAVLCSLDCGMEYLWKLREAQPKLSKSKEASNA